ncbi:hypothetical protein MYAM1_003943 [Malassezia yamatoensis]|uniref:Uncharacterized protein n=1 Tax=Malassezia yamatoensis TaxID=253288 RepID=A0AAJ5YYT2_9BASI|nr:hypothetical protein MYAM1_003943 [Malassezia yamatoensis]
MADGLSSTSQALRTNQLEEHVSENASKLWREAQSNKRRLDSMLKFTHFGTTRAGPEPFEMDVQLARTSLRNLYLALLLYETSLDDKWNVSMLLWNHTTYAVIAAFQEQLAKLEIEICNAETKRHKAPKNQRRSAKLHEFEHALHQFIQFLRIELLFWQDLIMRVVRVFHWENIAPLLGSLDLLDTDLLREQNSNVAYQQDFQDRDTFACGSYGPTLSQISLRLLQRLLMFCGDLERFIELKTHKPWFLIKRRNKHTFPIPYDFSCAQKWYRAAQQIPTNSGTPARKLALVAAESGDCFKALLHNYRALCMTDPDEKARNQLQSLLGGMRRKPDLCRSNTTSSDVAFKLCSYNQSNTVDEKCVMATLVLHTHLFHSEDLAQILKSAKELLEHLDLVRERIADSTFSILDLLISLICAKSLGTSTCLPAIIVQFVSLFCVWTRQALDEKNPRLLLRALPATRIGLKWLYVNDETARLLCNQTAKYCAQDFLELDRRGGELHKTLQSEIIPNYRASYISLLDAIPPNLCRNRRWFAEDTDLHTLAPFRDVLHPPTVRQSPQDTTSYLEDLLADSYTLNTAH